VPQFGASLEDVISMEAAKPSKVKKKKRRVLIQSDDSSSGGEEETKGPSGTQAKPVRAQAKV